MEAKQLLPNSFNTLEKLRSNYQLHRKIGTGSLSVVYQALNIHTQKLVAIKLFTNHHQPFETAQTSFLNEISIMYKLNKVPGIPTIHNAGKSEKGFFIEMDLLSSSLSEELSRKWSREEIRKLGCDVLAILESIHKEGIIHRDIKPDNILRDQNGKIYLVDFGLATYYQFDHQTKDKIPTHLIGIRKKRDFIGTPYYASLAAHLGYPQTPKSDIESLLYMMCRLHRK